MEYRLIRNDELYHYGVPGMRWGHRKAQPTSLAGTGHRAMAGVYGINQRFYNRTGNKTMASMNAQARNQALKKAAAADIKKQQKVNSPEYQAKVARAKKAVKVGAVIGATALATYGGYKMHKLYGTATNSLASKSLERGRERYEYAMKLHESSLGLKSVAKQHSGEMSSYLRNLADSSNPAIVNALKESADASRKGLDRSFSRSEVAKEMLDITRKQSAARKGVRLAERQARRRLRNGY